MNKFSNIVSTLAHDLEPVVRDSPQVIRMFLHPGIDGRIPFNRAGEPKELIHCVYTQKWRHTININVEDISAV